MSEESSTLTEKKEKSGFNFKIIIAGLVVFLVCMGSAYLVFRSLIAPILPESQNGKVEVLTGTLVPVGEFTTNVNDVAGPRFLRVEVTVETSIKKGDEVVKQQMPVISDTIINILSSQTVADLDIRNREYLKSQIKDQINTKLGSEVVNNVYFTKFIIQ